MKGSCMSTFKQISTYSYRGCLGYKERHVYRISIVSTNGTCLKNKEYIQSEQERILEMKVKFPMTLNKYSSSHTNIFSSY